MVADINRAEGEETVELIRNENGSAVFVDTCDCSNFYVPLHG